MYARAKNVLCFYIFHCYSKTWGDSRGIEDAKHNYKLHIEAKLGKKQQVSGSIKALSDHKNINLLLGMTQNCLNH